MSMDLSNLMSEIAIDPEIAEDDDDWSESFKAHPCFPFWASSSEDVASHDFNRDIIAPGINETYPAGVVGIRCDDDFWLCACLPFKYSGATIQELVAVLWPSLIDRAEYKPDSSDEKAWDAIFASWFEPPSPVPPLPTLSEEKEG